jgi:hypothetical protein
MFDAVAEPRGMAVGDVVAPDHVRGRPMDPGQARHLHDHPAGAGRAVRYTVWGRHPALRQRLDPGRQRMEPAEGGLIRVMPLEREIIARDLGGIQQRLLQLVAKDGFAACRFEALASRQAGNRAAAPTRRSFSGVGRQKSVGMVGP